LEYLAFGWLRGRSSPTCRGKTARGEPVSDKSDLDSIFSDSLPRSLRLSRRLDHEEGSTFRQRVIARWTASFRRRIALPEEYHLKPTEDSPGIEVEFAAPRVPLGLTIRFESDRKLTGATVQVWEGGRWRAEAVTWVPQPLHERGALFVGFKRLALTTRIRAFIEGLKREDEFEVIVLVGEYPYEDWLALREARQLAAQGKNRGAESEYLRSLKLAPKNGAAALEVAQLFFNRDVPKQAERWALAAGAYGDTKGASDLLRTIYEKSGADFAAEAPKLSAQAARWPGGKHRGAVCLLMHQNYWLGFTSWHLVKHRSLIEVRRRAAARMFRRLQFQLTPQNEHLLFARLRILQQDGKIKTASEEQFTLTDSPEHDPAVRTAEKKDASFFLPELHNGDILELEYCIVHDNALLENGLPNFFLIVDLVSDFPTFKSIVDIVCPAAWAVKCIGIHPAAKPIHTRSEDGWQTYTTEGQKLIADDWGTSSYERMLHNPHVCCSWDNRSWEDVGRHELRAVGATVEPPDPLPEVLTEAIKGDHPVTRKLESGFNWVRDRLKYMSLPSAKGRIAKHGRAQQIIDTGVGDCHDKAYLVHLICRELDLETEFLLVSANNGFVVRELPAGQFDHVLIRTKLNNEWLYLDATDTITPFGCVPSDLQGHSALRLGGQVQLVTIPENSPATNSIAISEILECSDAGDLQGQFRVAISGVPGRWSDDRWKSLTMGAPDPSQVAQLVLSDHLPLAHLEQWEVADYPGENGRFVFSGQHLRGRLTKIGERRVSFIKWNPVFFPCEMLRNRRWDRLAIFPMPLTLTLSVEVRGSGHWRIEGASTIPNFDADFGAVTERQTRTQSQLVLTRTLIVKKKFIHGSATKRIPDFLKVFEDALQVSLLFRRIGPRN